MFDLPYVIEPPDLLIVEVLETLPGRPISGERLVRPDGTISLGFYGDIHVRGLTLDQAKIKIIQRLRHWMSDESLGLFEDDNSGAAVPGEKDLPEVPGNAGPPPPPADRPGILKKPKVQPPDRGQSPDALPTPKAHKSVLRGRRPPARPHVRPISDAAAEEHASSPREEASRTLDIPITSGTKVSITISVVPGEASPAPIKGAPADEDEMDPTGRLRPVHPVASSSVFVDMGSYNSKMYFVQGDAVITGKFPWTGQETVLDAINNANGFMPTAEQRDVRLVRPARAGKPAKVYKIDFKAIMERGDVRQNYQLFPGDRIVVGRNAVVDKTVQLDRLYAPLQTVLSGIVNYSNMLRSVSLAAPELSAEQRQAIVSDWVDSWWKAVSGPGGAVLDKKAFDEALKRHIDALPKRSRPPETKN